MGAIPPRDLLSGRLRRGRSSAGLSSPDARLQPVTRRGAAAARDRPETDRAPLWVPRHPSMLWHPDEQELQSSRSHRPGSSSVMPGTRPGTAAGAAGNELGTTCAHSCTLRLRPAPLCAASSAETMKTSWWRGCGCIPGGQGVAGSNPAVPTGNRVFSNIVTPHKSQQESHLVVQWPFRRWRDDEVALPAAPVARRLLGGRTPAAASSGGAIMPLLARHRSHCGHCRPPAIR